MQTPRKTIRSVLARLTALAQTRAPIKAENLSMPPALRSSRPRSFRSTAIALLCTLLPGCATYRAAYEARLIGSLPNQRGVSIEESRDFPGEVL